MASLRTYQAAKLLRSATTSRIATPLVARRFQSNVTSATGVVPTTEDQNQPDYEAPQDKATSTFTPVPKRVQNGSEDVPYIQAGVLSDAPMELQARTVRYATPRHRISHLSRTNANSRTASTRRPSPPRSPATGKATTGAWTGTSSPRATDGRTLSWAGSRPPT